jgi:hypothetical protein
MVPVPAEGWAQPHQTALDSRTDLAQEVANVSIVNREGANDVMKPLPSAETSVGSDSGDADMVSDAGGRGQLSASASRRRRRQRAALYAKQEEVKQRDALVAPVPATASESNRMIVRPGGDLNRAECARLSAQIEAGGKQLSAALAHLRGNVRRFTLDAQGCRIMQLALQEASQEDAVLLSSELMGYVRRAMASPHGNYVIQKIVEVLPPAHVAFVIKELRGTGAETSRHRYGCRIMCRLLEHSAQHPLLIALVDEILCEIDELCRHSFGHHVIEAILEHGLPAQQQRIVSALAAQMQVTLADRNACYVLEVALKHCSSLDRSLLTDSMFKEPQALIKLAENRACFHMMKDLMSTPGKSSEHVRQLLRKASRHLHSSGDNRRPLEEGKRHSAAKAGA